MKKKERHICLLEFAIMLKLKNDKKKSRGEMQQLQMNPPWECGLINLINSYLAFSFFHFSTTTLLQLGVHWPLSTSRVSLTDPCSFNMTCPLDINNNIIYYNNNGDNNNI